MWLVILSTVIHRIAEKPILGFFYLIRGRKMMPDLDLAGLVWCGDRSLETGCEEKHKPVSR